MKRPLQWHEIVPSRLARERALLTGLPYFNLARTYFDESRRFTVIGSLRYTGQRSGRNYTLRVRLEYPRTFPQRVPQVMDHDKVFKPCLAGHLFSTYELCLTLPERGEFSIGSECLTEEVLGAALVWFHKRRLFEVNKIWPGPAERHGILASIDLLVEQRVALDADVMSNWLLAHASTPSGHPTEPDVYAPCPCGSSKSLKFCHRERLKPLLDRLAQIPRDRVLREVLQAEEGERWTTMPNASSTPTRTT